MNNLFKEMPNDRTEVLNWINNLPQTQESYEFFIELAKGRIAETFEEIEFRKLELEPFVSLSGKDSIIVLDLVRTFKPDVKHMFSNTGIEWPSHLKFWKEHYPDLEWVNSKMSQKKAYEKYGVPIVSKQTSVSLKDVLYSKSFKLEVPSTMLKRVGGDFKVGYDISNPFKISKKWLFLLDKELFPNSYRYSHKCCDVFKGNVKHLNGKWAFIGTRVSESQNRTMAWRRIGCINFGSNQTTPIALWPDWVCDKYVVDNNLELPETYTKLGMTRTGCYNCPFPLLHQTRDEPLNNLQQLYKHYPTVYNHTMNRLGLKYTYLYMGIPVPEDAEYTKELEAISARKKEWYNNVEYNFAKVLRINFDRIGYELPQHQLDYIAKSYRFNKFELTYWYKRRGL